MPSKDVENVIKKHMKYTRMFEEYDRMREFALDRIRRSFTIRKDTYWKLKKTSEARGTSMSKLIDDAIDKTY